MNNDEKIHERIIGAIDPLTLKRICIFAHFDANGQIADYVLNYVKALYEFGCAVFFVSNSGRLDSSAIEKVTPYVSEIIIREDHGYDFGALSVGFRTVDKYTHHDYLLLVNDSMYGPLFPLQSVDDFIIDQQEEFDVLGITDSYELGTYHLHAYFIMMKNRVFTSQVFKDFFLNMIFSNDKWFIITKYELGITQLFVKNNFKVKAMFEYQTIVDYTLAQTEDPFLVMVWRDHPGYRAGSVWFGWKPLIEKFRSPFIKRSLFRNFCGPALNPLNFPEVLNKTDYDLHLIKEYLSPNV